MKIHARSYQALDYIWGFLRCIDLSGFQQFKLFLFFCLMLYMLVFFISMSMFIDSFYRLNLHYPHSFTREQNHPRIGMSIPSCQRIASTGNTHKQYYVYYVPFKVAYVMCPISFITLTLAYLNRPHPWL